MMAQLDKILSKFHFVNTHAVRTMMATSGAVISESAALAILHPDRFIINNLDFFLTDQGYPALLAFVLDHGYKVRVPDIMPVDYMGTDIVLSLSHAASRVSINIIALRQPLLPDLCIILVS